MNSPRGLWGWMVIRRYDGSTSHQQCYQSSYHAGVCLRGTGNKRTRPLSPTDAEPSNGPSSSHLPFDSKPYPGFRFGLTCTRLLPQPHKPPFADPEPDTRADGGSRIRSATLSPYPQPMPSTPDHYLVQPHGSRERVRQPPQAGDGSAGMRTTGGFRWRRCREP